MGARKPDGCTFTLPLNLVAALLVYCGRSREQPGDVLADALALHLDELDAIGIEAIAHRTVAASEAGAPTGPAPAASGTPPPSEPAGPGDIPAFLRRPS
jgi:hypothetical protein